MIGVHSTEWTGLQGMDEELLREMKPKAEDLMWQAGARFQEELKRKLKGARTGRTYKVSKTGRLHVASAPGEAPAVLHGALRNTMGFSKPKWEGWTVSTEVGSGLGRAAIDTSEDAKMAATYSLRLEFGGISFHPWPVKIEKRPYMAPTAEKMDPILQQLFEARL